MDTNRNRHSRRPSRSARQWTAIVLTVCVVAGYAVYFIRSSLHDGRSISYLVISAVNLRSIAQEWLIQQHTNPQQATFNEQDARRDMRPALSPHSERAQIYCKLAWREKASVLQTALLPVLFYTALMSLICQRRLRRLLIAAALVLLVCEGLARISGPITNRLWPGSYEYLEDYVYLRNLNWQAPRHQWGTTVIAFEKESLQGDRLCAAFMDGHVEALTEQELRDSLDMQQRAEPLR